MIKYAGIEGNYKVFVSSAGSINGDYNYQIRTSYDNGYIRKIEIYAMRQDKDGNKILESSVVNYTCNTHCRWCF